MNIKKFWIILSCLGMMVGSMLAATTPDSNAQPVPPPTLWNQDALTGNWGGVRDELLKHGLVITPVYTGEVFGNFCGGAGGYNGSGRGVIYDHCLNLPVDLSLGKMVGGCDSSTIHANALWIAGPGLSPSYTGDLSNTSGIQGYNTFRLQELWFQQGLWDKKVLVKAGQIAVDADFFTTNSGSLFVNGTFGAFTLVGGNLPDPYDPNLFPMAAPGLKIMVQPAGFCYGQIGVFNGSTESQSDNPHGVHFPISSGQGALIFSEIGYLHEQSPGDTGLAGTYKIGSFVHTHNFNSWASQQNAAATGNDLSSSGANFGVYGVADQQVYSNGDRTISLFTRVGSGPEDVNAVSWYVDGGCNLQGFLPTRSHDVFGVAVARSIFGSSYSDWQVNVNGTAAYDAETVIEATYRYQAATWWTVQPDLQYLIDPSGRVGSPNAWVAGVRTSVAF